MNTLRKLARLGRSAAAFRRRTSHCSAMPMRLWVESTNHCNLRCLMCPNKDTDPSLKKHMDMELFRKIVDEARSFANDIYLHHRGEPLLNPELFDMIAYARHKGLRVRFHSNGSLLDETKAARLLETAPNMISFSVDGFEKHAYESIRVGAEFETTISNILRLVRMRRERGLDRPYVVVEKIRFQNPRHPENRQAVEELRRKFLDAGVNEVIEKDEYVWTQEDVAPADAIGAGRACTFPWYAMAICSDGTVTPCPQDFDAKLVMGNARDSSLADIWNGPAYRQLRSSFANSQQHDLCKRCDRLTRKTVGGIPFQYMATFLIDQLVGYNRIRQWLGTAER